MRLVKRIMKLVNLQVEYTSKATFSDAPNIKSVGIKMMAYYLVFFNVHSSHKD